MQDALILLCLLGGVLALWQWSVTGRERVLAISAKICDDLHLQRLDESVSMRRLRPVFADGMQIERGYDFEFSTDGADRRRGEIILRGNTLQWASVEHPDGPVFIDARGMVSPQQ